MGKTLILLVWLLPSLHLALLGRQTSHSQNTFFSRVSQYTIIWSKIFIIMKKCSKNTFVHNYKYSGAVEPSLVFFLPNCLKFQLDSSIKVKMRRTKKKCR